MKSLSNLVSCCGLICQTCPIYWVKQETDPHARNTIIEKIIKISAEKYDTELSATDVNGCSGCRGNQTELFTLCIGCKIRPCAESKGIEYCSYCTDFPCKLLEPLYKEDPVAQARLELIRDIL